MQVGKLPPDRLRSVIFNRLGTRRPDVLIRAGIGLDSAVIDFGDEVCVMSTDPITGAGSDIGYLAVHISCNDVAAHAAHPVGVLAVLLLPETSSEQDIAELMDGIHRAACELQIEVMGGHTEITSKVTDPVVAVTAVGRAPKGRHVSAAGASPGDELVLTKGAGIEGTAILANEYADALVSHLGADILRAGAELARQLSVVPEAHIAAAAGCTAMHDVTEGGLVGAIFEMCEAAGVGCDVSQAAVPVHPATTAICGALKLDPLGLLSSGSLLVAMPPGRGDELVGQLAARGIAAAKIGRFTSSPTKAMRIERGDAWAPWEPYAEDELWRYMKGS